MNNNISFLFGAGAENDYGLPQGNEFARKTLLNSNKELFDALADFYGDVDGIFALNNWISKYGKYTVQSNEIGRQIIVKTVSFIIRMYPEKVSTDSFKWSLEEFFTNADVAEIEEEPLVASLKTNRLGNGNHTSWEPKLKSSNVERRYLNVMLDWMSLSFSEEIPIDTRHRKLIVLVHNNLQSFGVLEQYFYTIINPKKYGPHNYWKLVNYYWQSYFTVVLPICNNLIKKENQFFKKLEFEIKNGKIIEKKENYHVFLKNIELISKELWSIKDFSPYKNKRNYHYYLQDMVRNAYGIITTNYTPIVCSTINNHQKLAMINGSLNLFEYPYELAVYDFSKESCHPNHNMYFPFIFGTSLIKPIVHSFQIEALATLKEILEESNTLVIIGYGLNEDDNHLNSFLRNFIYDQPEKQQQNRIIFCEFNNSADDNKSITIEPFDEMKVKARILSLLRINDADEGFVEEYESLKIICNKGDAAELFLDIEDYLNTISSQTQEHV